MAAKNKALVNMPMPGSRDDMPMREDTEDDVQAAPPTDKETSQEAKEGGAQQEAQALFDSLQESPEVLDALYQLLQERATEAKDTARTEKNNEEAEDEFDSEGME